MIKLIRVWEIIKLTLKSFKSPEFRFTIYFGVPGSGKTTLAAYLSNKIIKKGGRVWSNVPISGTYKLSPKDDIGQVMIENGTIMIDEAGLEYNNRDYKKFSQESTNFYKYHRHYKVSVNIFSQGYDDMDKKLRQLATTLYVVKKSILPFFVKRYMISKKIGINDLTKDICDEYFRVPFSGRYIFSPVVWTMFDSYSKTPLPEKQWELWS